MTFSPPKEEPTSDHAERAKRGYELDDGDEIAVDEEEGHRGNESW